MVEKFCSRSHGHPLPGVRSIAMISSKREISRDGVIAHLALKKIRLYAARRAAIPAKRTEPAALSTGWWATPSLRANGSRECAPDDRLREAIQTPSFRDGA